MSGPQLASSQPGRPIASGAGQFFLPFLPLIFSPIFQAAGSSFGSFRAPRASVRSGRFQVRTAQTAGYGPI